MLNETIWSAVIIAGILQGAFVGTNLLFQNHQNFLAGRLLASLVATLTIGILGELLEKTLNPQMASLIAFLNINTELALGPLLFLFLRSIVQPTRMWQSVDALHFLPFLLGIVYWGIAWVSLQASVENHEIELQSVMPVSIYLVAKIVVFMSYFLTSCLMLARISVSSPDFTVGNKSISAENILHWLVCLSVLPVCIYVVALLDALNLELPIEADDFSSIILVGIIYLSLSILLSKPWLLSLKPKRTRSKIQSELKRKLISLLENEKPWLDPELTLCDIAKKMDITENSVSAIIRDALDSSFYELINKYRLAEFDRLLKEPALENRYILNLAFDAGFSSKASFYRVFRSSHGTTPNSYRKRAKLT